MRGNKLLAVPCSISILCLGWLIVGCGPSNEDEVQSVVKDYYVAYLSGNSTEACDLLSPSGQDEMVDSVGFALSGAGSRLKRCQEAVDTVTSVFREDAASMVDEPEVEVRIEGDVAYATPRINGNLGNEFILRKIDGEWLLDGGFTSS